ncbi:hypothetical protein CNMCM5623_001884 [Aspergillus felis]|uniref:Uncharacterized protein n=1 Tax=Aspergillus felis TaxID=1287682 RepID=A0A8H6QAY5_9EURO|nr:hypothetical protein CNMCM5623_001884 [Aspergillus felis]KAF7179024.1 hypothetical protein CNMCM7691_007899 [Aspergillus felis]
MEIKTYTIVVHNENSEPASFLLFNEKPSPGTSIYTPWSNVWLRTNPVDDGGTATFTLPYDNWAVCGEANNPFDSGVSVNTQDKKSVLLQAGDTPGTAAYMYQYQDTQGYESPFFEKNTGTTDVANSFSIVTRDWNKKEHPLWICGLGRPAVQFPGSKDKDIVPVSVWYAEPNVTNNVVPLAKFYIATGSHKTGDVVNISTLANAAAIDFTPQPPTYTKAEITFTDDNDFTDLIFSPPN